MLMGQCFSAVYEVIHLILSVFEDNLFSDSQLFTLFCSFDTFSSTLLSAKSYRLK